MSGDESLLKDKHILAVDDEKDIIETIMDILGVNGLQLNEPTVEMLCKP
jgi:hypothetical protein